MPEDLSPTSAGGAPQGANRDLGSPAAPPANARPPRVAAYARERLLGLLASTAPCPACTVAACGPLGVCRPCAALLRRAVEALPDPTGETLWLGPHAGIWRRLVHALKYRHARRLAPFLAELLHVRLERWGWQPQLIVHLPTTPARRRLRGYDQADLLAAAAARLTGVPQSVALERRRATAKLVGLGRSARGASMAGAFRARYLGSARVLLIDDVLTTGASLAAAKAALAAAGALEVRAAVVARTSPAHEEGEEYAAALRLLELPAAPTA